MVNKEVILKQYRQLNREADDVKELAGNIRHIEQGLSESWKSDEADIVCRKLEEITYSLKKIEQNIVEFSHDYLKLSEMQE